MAEAPRRFKRPLCVPVIGLALAWWVGAAAATEAPTGLEFLEPKALAYVEVRGTLVNATTGAPIKGASVLAVWQGATYGFHSTSYHDCLRVDAATTQADGHFTLRTAPRHVYRMGMAQQYVDIRIHAPAMQEALEDGAARTLKFLPDQRVLLGKLIPPKQVGVDVRVPMIPAKVDVPDRIRALQLAGKQPKDCETMGNSVAVQGYFHAIATEAQGIARTRYQEAVAQALAAGAATAATALGKDEQSTVDIMNPVYESPDPSDVEWRDQAGATPLMNAAGKGDVSEVRALLAAGANPNRTVGQRSGSPEDSALTRAISGYGQFKASGYRYPSGAEFPATIAALLADPRTDPNVRGTHDGYTPLWVALHGRQDDVVEWLLAAGADPNFTAYEGKDTAIGVAMEVLNMSRDEKTLAPAQRQFNLLVTSRRTNLDAATLGGQPPLSRALGAGNLLIAKQLLEAGANPNALDKWKRTPLIWMVETAIESPQWPQTVERVRFIASWPGVDFNAQIGGKTALQMAQSAGRKDLVEILERR